MRVVHGLVRHEARLFVSLGLWLARRTHGTAGGRAFGYARGQGSTLFGLGFVCVVESFTMSVLLRDWPAAHRVVLLLDVYTLLFVVGLHAACVVRPHVLTPDALRVRYGAHVDLRIPLAAIGAVRRETRTTHERAAGELDLPVASRTTLTLELTAPVTRTTLFGRRRTASVVRLHAEDPDDLVRALTRALTRVRTGSSTCPDPLG
ncbi:hypothetical protein [Streptomyces diastatochromogenes]|uniref:Uncharacterized protein n=1 Tax=Streptomyces diastatochromogenes TaxID=42236 RepID=A0A233SEZ9_STRDA|nr:hypothetical protein [Streptomyces diastatochromogenes]OXY94228.1 hypothetical protein BEK98_20380 [Streptomyces diastatochromogenes]